MFKLLNGQSTANTVLIQAEVENIEDFWKLKSRSCNYCRVDILEQATALDSWKAISKINIILAAEQCFLHNLIVSSI